MDDLETQLQQLLSNPEQMKIIKSLAESLGLSPPGEEPQQQTQPEQDVPEMLQAVAQKASGNPRAAKSEALLQALKPFLRPERQQKLERAMQLARLSKVAGTFLINSDRYAP